MQLFAQIRPFYLVSGASSDAAGPGFTTVQEHPL
jgi:hypothetical protein